MRNLSFELMNGEIPDSLEEMAECGDNLTLTHGRYVPISSMIIAKASETYFNNNSNAWYSWVIAHFRLKGKVPYTRKRIGLRLHYIKDNEPKYYSRMMNMESKKLEALCKLAVTQIPAFLSSHNIEQMKREEAIAAVEAYLTGSSHEGNELPSKPRQAMLPGFDDAVDQLVKFDTTALRDAVRDASSAQKSLCASMALLGASLEFEKKSETPNVDLLQKAREALMAEAAEIEALIAEKTRCAMAHQKAISE